MKTKFYWVTLLASAALIGQVQGGDNHGGGMGGGFGGRGFSGGGHVVGGGVRAAPVGSGFRGGGFHAAAPAFGGVHSSVGVGARGGGVGFGIPRYSSVGARPLYRRPVYYNGRAGRSVTPSVGARTAATRPQNRFSSTHNPVGQRPPAAFGRPGILSAARPIVPIRTVTTPAFSRTITMRPLVVPRWLIPRSKLPRSGLLSSAITTVQSMEFSVRRRAMRWQSIRSTTS